jgi:hypothetical protein
MTEREDSLRAGHEDREKVVAQLNSAFAEGRLEVGELDERVAQAYAAKTMGDLVPLTADLPAPYASAAIRRAAQSRPPAVPEAHASAPALRWAPVGAGLGLFLLNVVIWGAVSLGTGDLVYFWPIWTAIPMALALIGIVAGGGGHGPGHGRDRG